MKDFKQQCEECVNCSVMLVVDGNPKPYYGVVDSVSDTHILLRARFDNKLFLFRLNEVKLIKEVGGGEKSEPVFFKTRRGVEKKEGIEK